MDKSLLGDLEPKTHNLFIDLAREAGFDVADWSNFSRGAKYAAANPKYCYEWTLIQGERIILNTWFDNIEFDGINIIQNFNFLNNSKNENGVRRSRSLKADQSIKNAFVNSLSFYVIIMKRSTKNTAPRVLGRLLDTHLWSVKSYDFKTGDSVIWRKELDSVSETIDLEAEQFLEGEPRQQFVWHRKREAKLRKQKIAETIAANQGRLCCEVRNCGFDFKEQYGAIGEGFAHVHHLSPLHTAPFEGRLTSTKDLAVVCANCHAMIHIGGGNRDLDTLLLAD